MPQTLRLRLLTPQRQMVDETVDALTAEGALGQFGVLPQHVAFLTTLEPGVLAYRKGAAETKIAIKGGYAEVRDESVTVLADEAVRVEEIRAGDARAALEKASAALAGAPYGHPDHEQARREVRWAETLVAVGE